MSTGDLKLAEQAGDRLEQLTEEQRARVLWRLCYRHPELVQAVIDSFEATAWEWGR